MQGWPTGQVLRTRVAVRLDPCSGGSTPCTIGQVPPALAAATVQGMDITYEIFDEQGDEHAVTFPARYEVCSGCRGTGGSSAYLGAFSSANDEDMDWLEENGEDYLSGAYDRTCEECNGLRVVVEIDRDFADADDLALYDADQQLAAEYAAERAAEIRAGC